MLSKIFVYSIVPDARAEGVLRRLRGNGFRGITDLKLVDIYSIDKRLSNADLRSAASALCNPVTQGVSIGRYAPQEKYDWAVEVGFLPGVTDNIATTAKESISDLLGIPFKSGEGIYTSQAFYISGAVSQAQVKAIGLTISNPLIQRISVDSRGKALLVPKVTLSISSRVDMVNINISDDELIALGTYGIPNHDGTRRGPLALDLASLKAIQAHFRNLNRKPTDIELESLAQTWSEHCKHTIFSRAIDEIGDGLFSHYIQGATQTIRKKLGKKDFCVSVFTDNSGAIVFDDTYAITAKVETHNSPSALEPYGGALTGIVGVNRDCLGFGLGAKPIANVYGFCVGDPRDTSIWYRDAKRTQSLLSPKRILEGVVAGVNTGGNCSGIPTPLGFVHVDAGYRGKPLIFAGTIGLIPQKFAKKQARSGEYIVMMGGRVGIDGIHGATFSSEALTSGSPATAVQIGDPITQKKMSDMLIKEARDAGLYTSITDNGAGGLSCSVAEMAKESNGCLVDLEKVPLKYSGLAPWQIWISESQERMTLSVPKSKWKKLKELCNRRGVEATIIGTFTKSSRCVVRYKKKKIMDLSLEFLHNGLPRIVQKSSPITVKRETPALPKTKNLTSYLLDMLRHPNMSSAEWISMQYDHEVQATSVLKPLQGNGRVCADTTIIRPILSSRRGVVLSQAIYPEYGEGDPYYMAAHAIDTAVGRAIAAGADPTRIALLDNFCWSRAKDPYRLGQLKEAARGCYDYATFYNTPFISGKDSMFNDFSGFDARGKPISVSIPPTLLISAIGIFDDVTDAVSLDFKMPGDLLYVVGELQVGAIDAKKQSKIYMALARAIKKGLIASSFYIDRGGLIMALTKCAIGGQLGVKATVNRSVLFTEFGGTILVSVDPKQKRAFEGIVKDVPYAYIGSVIKDLHFKITDINNLSIINTSIKKLTLAYKAYFSSW